MPVEKRRRTRGLPMAPVLASAGNGTTLIATAAYSAGGPAAAAAAGAVVAAGAAAAVLRRRASVRRGMAARQGGGASLKQWRGGSGLRSGPSGSVKRAGSGVGRGSSSGSSGAGSGTRSGLTRSGSTRNGGPFRSGFGAGRHGGASGGSSPLRGGLLRKSLGRHARPDRSSGPGGSATDRQQKNGGGTDKAVKKALKRAAKDLTAKTATSGKTSPAATLKAAAGRTARAAWTASRPHLTRAGTAAARVARHTGGALADGLRAAAAGAWAWLRHRDPKTALDRLKTVWKRLRKHRATPDPDPTPPVADTVRRPADTAPTTLPGGTRMSGGGHHFVAPAMELARAAANYQPTGMLQVGADFAGLEEALRLHAEAMKITVENADATQPLAPQIVELMRQVHGLQLKAAELAAELTPAFRQLHDVDIARLENPRKGTQGERMWDVSTNL
jgi:hypothetical protein